MIDNEYEINTSSKKNKEEIKWRDDDEDNLEINLNSKNKLKKLKKNIKESKIKGSEYEERIREQYNSMHNEKEKNLFKWAEGIEDDEERFVEIAINVPARVVVVDFLALLRDVERKVRASSRVLVKVDVAVDGIFIPNEGEQMEIILQGI